MSEKSPIKQRRAKQLLRREKLFKLKAKQIAASKKLNYAQNGVFAKIKVTVK